MSTPLDLRAHAISAPAYRLFVVFWGGMALADLTRAVNTPAPLQFIVIAALAAICCARQGRGTALAVAVIAWLVVTGFVVNAYGVLHLTGVADGVRLAILTVVALAATEVRR
jgi:phosphotransferase system  glucose/maltose/N-acetylglucosamine-specific IIC component